MTPPNSKLLSSSCHHDPLPAGHMQHPTRLLRNPVHVWQTCLQLPPGPVSGYGSKLSAMTQFVARQASGLPTGPHAAFKTFMVDAATARLGGKVGDVPVADPMLYPTLSNPGCLQVQASRAHRIQCRSFTMFHELRYHAAAHVAARHVMPQCAVGAGCGRAPGNPCAPASSQWQH